MTTRLERIEGYLAAAKQDGEHGELLLPAEWVQQLVDIGRAAEPLAEIDRCRRWPAATCSESDEVGRDEWCATCLLRDALVAFAWADDAFAEAGW